MSPFLLQTPAAGPREEECLPDPPYFRELKIMIRENWMALRSWHLMMGQHLRISLPGDFEPTLKRLIERIMNEARRLINAKFPTLVY